MAAHDRSFTPARAARLTLLVGVLLALVWVLHGMLERRLGGGDDNNNDGDAAGRRQGRRPPVVAVTTTAGVVVDEVDDGSGGALESYGYATQLD